MKKRHLFLALLFILCSCSKKEENKVLIESTYKIERPIDISANALVEKIENEENFILYVSTSGCSSCDFFENNCLFRYIKNSQIDIYKASVKTVDSVIDTPSKYKTNPRLVIYENGKVLKQTTIRQNKEVFESEEGLKNYIEKYCFISNKIKVNYDDLEALAISGECIYFGWKSCGDCQYFDEHILPKYINSNYYKFYYFDVDEFRKNKDEEPQKWHDFVNKFELDFHGNGGKVPTLIQYNHGLIQDYFIYLNDFTETNTDGSFKVVKTCFNETDASYVGKTYISYQAYIDESKSYFEEKLSNFFETNLKANN